MNNAESISGGSSSMPHIRVNGRASSHIDAQDRGLHFGDGVFETIAVLAGQLDYWSYHCQRLQEGCLRLAIMPPDEAQLLSECQALIAEDMQPLVIKIIMTRGQQSNGYGYPRHQPCTRILIRKPWPNYPMEYLTQGVNIGYSCINMAGHPRLAGIKHLNALEQVLAAQQCAEKGWQECLRFDAQGHVIEGCKSNVFLVKEGRLLTPEVSQYGVAGVMRRAVIVMAEKKGCVVDRLRLRKNDIEHADEVFFTNSLMGLWPVRCLQLEKFNHTFSIGSLTKKLINWLDIKAYYR